MPASRSARAMILAPRSCPSRPGLATTTRILRPEPPASAAAGLSAVPSMRRGSLEDGGLRIGAEDLLQGGHDLALGGVHAGAVEQRVHQVAVALRDLLELRERGLDLDAAPARADPLEAIDLLALERRVDAQDLELGLVVVAVAVHAHDDPLAAVDLLLE